MKTGIHAPRALITASAAIAALALALAACNGSDHSPAHAPGAAPSTAPATTSTHRPPGIERQATLHGALTLDGAPLDARFLGARVVRDGRSAACQDIIPAVDGGRYEITIAADAEVRGCGLDGAAIVLWTFVDDRFLFTSTLAPWPGDGVRATFDASFSTAAPLGATTPVTEFKGHLFDASGAPLDAGTVIQAHINGRVCGTTSLRQRAGWFTMIVAGPDAVPGCDAGVPISFTLDGRPAAETMLNTPGAHRDAEQDLTLAPTT